MGDVPSHADGGKPDVESWTGTQWEDWYDSEVAPGWEFEDFMMSGGKSNISDYESKLDYYALSDKYSPDLSSDFAEIRDLFQYNPEAGGGGMTTAFLNMPNESRIRFYEHWQDAFGATETSGDEPAEWVDPATLGVAITLPDGTQTYVSGEEFETTDGNYIPASNTVKKALMLAGGLGAIVVIAVLVFLFNGGDSTPEVVATESVSAAGAEDACDASAGCTETSQIDTAGDAGCDVGATCDDFVIDDCSVDSGCDTTDEEPTVDELMRGYEPDPFADLFRSYPDLDEIDGDRSVDGVSGYDFMEAVDILGLEVISNPFEDETTIGLTFNGAAQDIVTEESGTLMSRSITADVLITPPEGRILNVILRADGKVKISDIPAGMSIASQWVAPDELIIIIAGLALDPGTQVEAFVLLDAYGGFMSDVVSLVLSSS